MFNALEERLSIQIRNGKKILELASNWLEPLLNEGKISLQSLSKLSDEAINFERETVLNQKNTEIEFRLDKIRQQTLETVQTTGTAVQLRHGQIAEAFLEVLNSAKHQILIYSPWINHAVLDEEFITLLQKLVNRSVGILIGYGIARRQEDEEKPIPPQVQHKLQAIKTPECLPGIQIFGLGNSQVTEVIVDRKIHLCSYHNWLSY
jgi:phosphatidylserine/phosphatidylglycerophosphate/cardiolipin synthase-like enzyme